MLNCISDDDDLFTKTKKTKPCIQLFMVNLTWFMYFYAWRVCVLSSSL